MVKYQNIRFLVSPRLQVKYQVFWIITFFTLFHIITSATLSLGDDEAYYWELSRHLDLSYYDHPPLIAYLIHVSTLLFGNSPLAVRLPNLIMLPIVSIVVYRISKYLFNNPSVARNAVIILNVLPTFLLGSLLISPDSTLIFFYTLGLYLFIHIIYNNKAYLWYWLGIVVGMGMLSKYTMVLFILSCTLFLLLNQNYRFWLRKKEPYLALLIVLIIFLPVVLWNYQHEFASFKFQFYTRHKCDISLVRFLSFFGLQILILSPILGVLMVITWIKQRHNAPTQLLSCFAVPAFTIFGLVALVTPVRFNWPIISYIPLVLIFTAPNIVFSKFIKAGILLNISSCSIIIIHTYYPLIKINSLLKNDPTTDFYSWSPVAEVVDDFLANLNNPQRWFIFTNRYQSSSQLEYHLNGKYEVYSLADHLEGPSFWQSSSQILEKNGLLVMNNAYSYQPEDKFDCDRITLYKSIPIIRHRTVFRTMYIYECFNYHRRKNSNIP